MGTGVKVQALKWKQRGGAVQGGAGGTELSGTAKWRRQRERSSPSEATHLAITFRLTEAYTEARGGRFTHRPPTPLPETPSLCLKVHESSRQRAGSAEAPSSAGAA